MKRVLKELEKCEKVVKESDQYKLGFDDGFLRGKAVYKAKIRDLEEKLGRSG